MSAIFALSVKYWNRILRFARQNIEGKVFKADKYRKPIVMWANEEISIDAGGTAYMVKFLRAKFWRTERKSKMFLWMKQFSLCDTTSILVDKVIIVNSYESVYSNETVVK